MGSEKLAFVKQYYIMYFGYLGFVTGYALKNISGSKTAF